MGELNFSSILSQVYSDLITGKLLNERFYIVLMKFCSSDKLCSLNSNNTYSTCKLNTKYFIQLFLNGKVVFYKKSMGLER